MSTNARLLVEVAASLGTFREDLGKAAAVAEANAKRIERAFATTKQQLLNAGKTIAGAFGVSLGVAGVVSAFESIAAKTLDEQRSLAQLNAVIEATGHAAGLTREQLEKLNNEVQGKSIFNDDAIRKAEIALLRFRDVQGDVFKQALRLVPDIATALGVDLPTAAVALGKALTDPEHGMKALKAAGLSLSEQNKDLAARFIEAGNKAGAQKIVIDELTESIGGAAEADNKGLYGATKRLGRAFDDLQKAAGKKLLGDNAGLVDRVTERFERLTKVIDGADFSLGNLLKRLPLALSPGGALALVAEAASAKPEQPGRSASGKIDFSAFDAAEAERGRLKAQRDLADEAAYVAEQAALKQRAAIASSFYGTELAQQKAYLDDRQARDEFAYSRGELTIEEFYARQKKAVNDFELATVEANEKTIAASRAFANAPRTTQAERLAEEAKIANLQAQSLQSRITFGTKLIQLDQQQQLAVEKLGDEYLALAEKIALASGDNATAAAIGFEKANRDQRRLFEHIRDTGTPEQSAGAIQDLAGLKRLEDLAIAQGALTDKARAYSNTIEELGIEQARIDLARESGSLSEIGAINAKAALAKDYIGILSRQADAYEAIARSLQAGPEQDAALLRVKKFRLEIEQLAASSDVLAKKFNDVFAGAFADAITDAVTGTKSLSAAFRDMERSIVQSISRIAAQNIADKIFGKSGAGGGIGSFFSGIFSGTATGDIGDFLKNLLPKFATGTNFAPGGLALVGERGPEIINLPKGSQVTPAGSGKLAPVINIAVNQAPGASRASAEQLAAETGRAVQRAIRSVR